MTEAPLCGQRVFFALWPDEPALTALDAATAQGVARCGGRRMRRDSLHMTLEFIGAVTPVQLQLLKSLAAAIRVPRFQMEIDRFGFWHHNRILWAGCREMPSGQRRLLDALQGELAGHGFKDEQRAYVPHVTLVRHARCDELPVWQKPVCWQVSDWALAESFLQPSGARYRTLARWPLLDSA